MILSRFLRDRVTVIRFDNGAKNRQGQVVRVKVGEAEFPALLEQQTSQELSLDRTTLIDIWLVYLPTEAVIDAGDQVRNADRIFEVVGSPNVHQGIRSPSHITAKLRYVSEVNSAPPTP